MNLYLLAPELALGLVAFLVILLDLFLERKAVLAVVGLLGIALSAALSLGLWGQKGIAFAGSLVLDDFSLLFKLLFLGVAALVILSSIDYSRNFSGSQGEYYALVLLSAGGMMLMAATVEFISIFIALELTGISLYVLAGFLKDEKSSEAGLKFLLLGAVSSAVLLYGMALVFGLTGTTYLEGIAKALPLITGTNYPVLLLGVVLMVAGLGFKMASVPFQMWVPDVYEGAPTPITAYLSVASKAAAFALGLRIFYVAFGSPPLSLDWGLLFAVLSVLSMTLGNVVALVQGNIKRMMGYSSIAQAGYLLVGLATYSLLGRSGVIFFLVSYALTNLGAFIAIIAVSNQIGSDLIEDYSGVARRAPMLALALTLSLLSLTGIPPTVGFIAKVYLFKAAVENGLAWLVAIAVVNTVVSAYYYLRVVKAMYLGAPASEERIYTSGALRAALAVAVLGLLFLGIYPTQVIQVAEAAARTLIG